jgi:hypothetical protein
MNTLNGIAEFQMDGKKYTMRLTLNALRMCSKGMDVKFSEFQNWLEKDPLTSVPALCYYGVINQIKFTGSDEDLEDFDTFCARALDDSAVFEELTELVVNILTGGEEAKKKVTRQVRRKTTAKK